MATALGKVGTKLRRTFTTKSVEKTFGTDEIRKAKQAIADDLGVAFEDVSDEMVLRRLETDIPVRAAKGISTRAGATVLGTTGIAGGAYYLSNDAQRQAEEAKTQRYEEYQAQLRSLWERYQSGDISYDEYMRLREQAKEDYEQSNNPDQARGWRAWLTSLGPLQLLVIGLAGAFIVGKTAPAVVNAVGGRA